MSVVRLPGERPLPGLEIVEAVEASAVPGVTYGMQLRIGAGCVTVSVVETHHLRNHASGVPNLLYLRNVGVEQYHDDPAAALAPALRILHPDLGSLGIRDGR